MRDYCLIFALSIFISLSPDYRKCREWREEGRALRFDSYSLATSTPQPKQVNQNKSGNVKIQGRGGIQPQPPPSGHPEPPTDLFCSASIFLHGTMYKT